MIDFAPCKTCKMGFLDVEYSILIKYYYQIAKASTVSVLTEWSTGQPTEDPPNSDR